MELVAEQSGTPGEGRAATTGKEGSRPRLNPDSFSPPRNVGQSNHIRFGGGVITVGEGQSWYNSMKE